MHRERFGNLVIGVIAFLTLVDLFATQAILPSLVAHYGVSPAAMGLAVCWTVGAVLLYLPGQTELRHLAQESKVVSALTEALPPQRVMDAVGGIDPFSAIVGPATQRPRTTPPAGRRRRQSITDGMDETDQTDRSETGKRPRATSRER